jgi:hypothetical protein
MKIIVLTPPPFLPITVAEAYAHLRWDTEFEGSPPTEVYPLQDLVTRNITTATTYVEQITRRAIIRQTLKMVLPGFPFSQQLFSSRWGGDEEWFARPGRIELPRPEFGAMVSVKYLDKDEVEQTLAPSNYYVDADSGVVPMLVFRDTFDVDIATTDREDAVRVTWTAGYEPAAGSPATQADYAANVPSGIKDAILLQTQLLTDRFDPKERADIERARDNILASYTVRTF